MLASFRLGGVLASPDPWRRRGEQTGAQGSAIEGRRSGDHRYGRRWAQGQGGEDHAGLGNQAKTGRLGRHAHSRMLYRVTADDPGDRIVGCKTSFPGCVGPTKFNHVVERIMEAGPPIRRVAGSLRLPG